MTWFNSIKLSRVHLEMMFDMDYVPGVVAILQTLLPIENSESLPLKCFEQKDNIIYIFHEDKWQTMSVEMFDTLIMSISKKLIGEFIVWHSESSDQMASDDFAATYAKNSKRVMGGNTSIELLGLRVKKELFKYLKVNLKTAMECDFI